MAIKADSNPRMIMNKGFQCPKQNAPNRETIVIPAKFQKFVLADSGLDDKLRIMFW